MSLRGLGESRSSGPQAPGPDARPLVLLPSFPRQEILLLARIRVGRSIWRVGLDPGAARERVRVARALGGLPQLAAALARGKLSYSKVRALTRVATPETEARLLAVGRAGAAAHVERIVRGWRRVDRQLEAQEAAARHQRRSLQVYPDEDGMWVVRGRLEPETGAMLLRRSKDRLSYCTSCKGVVLGTPPSAFARTRAVG